MSPQKIVIHCQDGPYCTIEVHLPEKSYYASMESTAAVRTAPTKLPPTTPGGPFRLSRDLSSVSVASAASYQIEKKQQPTFVTSTKVFRPAVKRRSCKRLDLGGGDDALPLSIQLTGGVKLRKAGLTGKGIRVGVIDSGIDRDHPGFNGKVTKQMWFRYGTPLEMDDHGTHVAGTIHMMAPDAEIYDYRVFGEDGGISVEDAIMVAIYEAVFDGCHVINMSLGGRWPSSNIYSAVQFAESKDVIVVCAAGNEGDNDPLTNERSYPALWDEAISVAAVSKVRGLPVARFSNSNPQVDYAAIGVDVKSFKPGNQYQEMSGTSMASPHVCGFIAAVLSGWDEGWEEQTTLEDEDEKPTIRKDRRLRKYLEKKHIIDINVSGRDDDTGVGFLTFLAKEEYEGLIEQL